MTRVGVCGIFIPDRVQASLSGANRKVSNRLGVGGTTACWGWGWYIKLEIKNYLNRIVVIECKIYITLYL